MTLDDWIRCQGEDRDRLLGDARRIARELPAPTDGSMIALAFGLDRRALAAALVACWLRGHGAAVVENSRRERIQRVLEHPSVVSLMHDTSSGRALQVPRLLAQPGGAATHAPMPAALPSPMLAVDVQTEDGDLSWCAWDPAELTDAVDGVPGEPARVDARATPGLISSLFVDTLAWLRGAAPLVEDARRPADVRVPGAPTTATRHAPERAALLSEPGIDDVAFVHDADGATWTALVGPRAAEVAHETPRAGALRQVPRDENGQPLRSELFLKFGLGRRGQPVTRELTWRAVRCDDGEATWQTDIPKDYIFYEGHFDGYPVLAGGVQLHELVMPRLRALTAALPPLQQLDGIKFLARFVPGETIDLTLRRSEDGHKVTFEVRRDETRCTTGRLTFASPIPPWATPGALTT